MIYYIIAENRVEIQVQDFSFSDGVQDQIIVEIEGSDIKGSELHKKIDTNGKLWSPDGDKIKDTELLQKNSYSTSIMTLSKDEQQQILFGIVLILGFICISIMLTMVYYRKQAAMNIEKKELKELLAKKSKDLETNATFDIVANWNSFIRKQIAYGFIHHLSFIRDAERLISMMECVKFDPTHLKVYGLAEDESTEVHENNETTNESEDVEGKPQTFFDATSMLQEMEAKGVQGHKEILALQDELRKIPRSVLQKDDLLVLYNDIVSWCNVHQKVIEKIKKQVHRIEAIASSVFDVLEIKLNSDEVVSKSNLMALLNKLKGPPENSSRKNLLGAFEKSATHSKHDREDEFTFLITCFEENQKRQKWRQEVQHIVNLWKQQKVAMKSFSDTDASVSTSDDAEECEDMQKLSPTSLHNAFSSSTSHEHIHHSSEYLIHKLESLVDEAEANDMTHLDEVTQAQLIVDENKRQQFNAITIGGRKGELESLTREFVAQGADQGLAVLKAGEIVANQSNTQLLVGTLKTAFDEMRRRDIMKMKEKRNRDATKAMEKNQRLVVKFQFKQKYLLDKIQAQKELELEQEALRLERKVAEMREHERQRLIQKRQAYVKWLTYCDLVLVATIMIVICLQSISGALGVQTSCEDSIDSSYNWIPFLPRSWVLWECQLRFAMKTAVVLIVPIIIGILLTIAGLQVIIAPIAVCAALYLMRGEWINMGIRFPYFAFVVAFNALGYLLIDRLDNHVFLQQHKSGVIQMMKYSSISFFMIYIIFPLISFGISILIGILISCNAPSQCIETSYNIWNRNINWMMSIISEAYGVKY